MEDVRASYLRFPGWTQHLWTWQTGKALPGQQPLIRHTWASYLAVTLTVFFAGLGVSTAALAVMFPYWYGALVAGWFLTVCGARMMVLVIAHQALHRRFSGSARTDGFWGEAVTVLSVFHTFREFKEEHFDNHHRREIFATEADPPVQFLLNLGFRPGVSRTAQWRRAWTVFLSPAFYWQGFASRVGSNLRHGTWRRLGFAVWAGWWLSLPLWLPNGALVLVLGFVLPVIVFAQLSALLDRLGEHEWLTPRNPEYGHRYYTVANTSARFCGSPVPARSVPLAAQTLAWLRWIPLTLFYHLPCRLLVVVGDLPSHDYHHRYPSTTEWTTAAYARQGDIDTGPAGPDYQEVWGMGAAIDRVFRSWEGESTGASARS
ncbi:fatty acid desaturase [Streptomyces sp. NPDC005571]|uniref:fatty acid desaturase n=1 Tax=Streptomyces sp. NPDC005571 TaxID=3156888 RepID=UPI0033A89084